MLKFPCLVLDHDDTVVQSETSVNYPFFCRILDQYRPGTRISLEEYTRGCFSVGFAEMCRSKYQFTEQELIDEYSGWMEYVTTHIPDPFPGIASVIRRQKESGGILCVVSHSSHMNITRDYQKHFGILPDDIYGWDYPEHQRKPNPYPLEQIMKKYALSPHEILVVDDMKPAYEMCRAAKVPLGFAAWGRTEYPELSEEMAALADYSFQTVEQLETFLFDDIK